MKASVRYLISGRSYAGTAQALVLTTATVAGMWSGAASRLLAQSEASSPAGRAAREAAEFSIPPGQTPTPANTSEKQALNLRAKSSQTGQPLKGVKFFFHGRIGEEKFEKTAVTGDNGTVFLSWRKGVPAHNVWFTARAPGYVPVDYNWGDDSQSVEIPELVDLQFEPGNPIGGVVHDEQGHPIEGVRLQVWMPLTWSTKSGMIFIAETLKTDAEGRWTWRDAPADCSHLKIQIDHAQYEHSWAKGDRSQQLVYVLKRRPNASPGSPNGVSKKSL